jgi:type IV conjugative transfer system coupling protein TraD
MGLAKTLTEGGQIWAHRLRMLRQVVKLTIIFSLLLGFIFFLFKISILPKEYFESVLYFYKASIIELFEKEIEIDPQFLEAIGYVGKAKQLSVLHVMEMTKPYVDAFWKYVIQAALSASLVAFIMGLVIIIFFVFKGSTLKEKRYLSGGKLVPDWRVTLQLRCSNSDSQIKIGRLPLVKNSETQHILITGGTGSGKTNCLHHIIQQTSKINQPALIVDTTGIFIERYFDPQKDILLNPFDERCAPWHPWAECQSYFDYEAIAESFIPQANYEHENYWRVSARSVFSSLLQKLNDTKKNSELKHWVLYESLPNLCKFVQGTKAASHLDMSSEKTASSIRSVATTFLDCLECLKDTEEPFSIRDWVSGKGKSRWLFIQCNPAQRVVLRPLLSTWISIAIRSLISLKPDLERRLWFFLDELPTLQRIKDLETLVTEGRKYGGCGVLVLQSPSQMEAIYGNDLANTIMGNTATKIVFSERDPIIAEKISKSFGEQEIKEINEGISYGANEVRDGVSLSWQNRHRPLVSPTDIQSLEKHEAFLKLPGSWPATKIKLPIVKISK